MSHSDRQAIRAALWAVIGRLKLNRPALASFLAAEEATLVSQVESDLTLAASPPPGVDDLAWRAISALLYRLFVANPSAGELQAEAYQWLGEYFYRQLLRLLHGNQAEAEDLTNQSLMKVYQNLGQCRQPAFFLNWVRQIAVNEGLQYRRKEQRHSGARQIEPDFEIAKNEAGENAEREYNGGSRPGKAFSEGELIAGTESAPEKQVIEREVIRLIAERIGHLKDTTRRARDYKRILYGTYFQGLSDEELAGQLNISPQEVQKRRYQALKLLRQDKDWLDKLK